MFNFNYLPSSFPSTSLFPAANFNREVNLSHASSLNCGHDDHVDLDAKTKNKKKKKKKKKKKGRHTKIWTARGERDRRVRLSMEVSRKFFGLHDALGFDMASDTLEWLISESSNAIKEVKLANEVRPGGGHQFASTADAPMVRDPSGCNRTEKESRKECRARARARARERTQAKKNHHIDGCNS